MSRRFLGRGRTFILLAVGVSASVGAACGRRPTRELRAVLAEPVVSLDPFLSSAEADRLLQGRPGRGGFTLLFNIYESLVWFREDRKPEPALAVAWHNPDALTWVFDLRRGVRLHDGSTLTAADIVAVINHMRATDAMMAPHLRMVESATAEGDYTVRIKTKTPAPLLLSQLSFVPVKPKAGVSEPGQPPNGTGPFRYAGRDPDGTHRLEAFAGHWRGRPVWDRVSVSVETKSEARLARLVRGEADFVENLAPAELEELRRRPELEVLPGAVKDTVVLGLPAGGGASNPFGDPRVREAVDRSIDRIGLARERALGFAHPASQFVSPNVFGRIPGLPLVERDVSRARELLGPTRYAKGFTCSVLCETDLADSARAIARDVAAVGITLEIQTAIREEVQRRLEQGEGQAFLVRARALAADGSDLLLNYFHTRNPAARQGMLNWSGFSDPELDELIDSARAADDSATRFERLARAMVLAVQSRAMLPLVTRHDAHGGRKGMTFSVEPRGYVRFVDVTPPRP